MRLIEDTKCVIKSFLYHTEMAAKGKRTNIPNAEVLEFYKMMERS